MFQSAEKGYPEPYSHPVLEPLIIKTIYMGNGVGRLSGLAEACSVKLDDNVSFNPIPTEMLALAATAVTYLYSVISSSS